MNLATEYAILKYFGPRCEFTLVWVFGNLAMYSWSEVTACACANTKQLHAHQPRNTFWKYSNILTYSQVLLYIHRYDLKQYKECTLLKSEIRVKSVTASTAVECISLKVFYYYHDISTYSLFSPRFIQPYVDYFRDIYLMGKAHVPGGDRSTFKNSIKLLAYSPSAT